MVPNKSNNFEIVKEFLAAKTQSLVIDPLRKESIKERRKKEKDKQINKSSKAN